MAIVITLSPELEALLRDGAARQGQDISLVASELLASVLEQEEQDSEEAIQGIQQGLEDFEAGRFRSFEDVEITVVERLGGHPEHLLQTVPSNLSERGNRKGAIANQLGTEITWTALLAE